MPPEIDKSTREERLEYIRTKFRCRAGCDNCGPCQIYHGRDLEVVYADYIDGKRTFLEISQEYR